MLKSLVILLISLSSYKASAYDAGPRLAKLPKWFKNRAPGQMLEVDVCKEASWSEAVADPSKLGPYEVESKFISLSSELTGQKTQYLRMQDIEFKNEFNGIWACASLLHIDKKLTESVFNILCNALRDDGVLYASYQYGKGISILEDRYYNNYDERSFAEVIENVNNLKILTYWITKDLRPDRIDEKWLNVILKKI